MFIPGFAYRQYLFPATFLPNVLSKTLNAITEVLDMVR